MVVQVYGAIATLILWWVALLLLRVPLAFLWAALAAVFHLIPNLGLVLALIGPVLALLVSGGGWARLLYLFIAYALIALIDGFVLGPYLMKSRTSVPFFVSLVVPILLGIVIPFWGVLIAPPLLAIVYAFKRKRELRISGPER